MRRRIWSETVPFETLRSPRVIDLLRRFSLSPIVAVFRGSSPEAGELVARYADAGIEAALWPMLTDAEGRWASASTAAVFAAFVREVAGVPCGRAALAEIAVDLEPPIEDLRNLLDLGWINARVVRPLRSCRAVRDRPTFEEGRAILTDLARWLAERGVRASAAVAPVVVFEGWQEMLGTPVDGPAWDGVSVMLYSSILEGWSRVLGREDVRAVVALGCRAAVARFGSRAEISLGAVGTGALGDEPTYRSPAELADNVAIARASGADHLALFDLGGVLRRPPPERWLEAFVSTPAARELPPGTLRSRVGLGAARLAGGTAAFLSRLR